MLLVEAGSTKTSFAIIDLAQKKILFNNQIEGFNMMLIKDEQQIQNFLNKIQLATNYQEQYQGIEFYCAGCKAQSQKEKLQLICAKYFSIPKESVAVYDDLSAAARAACKSSPGIVAILGTGSNSCIYDGAKVVQQISPLGFILGDEGSGSALGKNFLKEYLRKQLPDQITKDFNKQFEITEEIELYNKIYQDPKPNVYLASLTKFIYNYKNNALIQKIIIKTFEEFVINCLEKYQLPDSLSKEISFIGSIAEAFKEELLQVLLKYGYKIKEIIQDPFSNLINYYF